MDALNEQQIDTEPHSMPTERLSRLYDQLGIRRAYLAGVGYQEVDLAATYPDLTAAVALVCPTRVPSAALRALGGRLLVIHGDGGPGASLAPDALRELPDANGVLLKDYVDALWADAVADRLADITPPLLAFLSAAERRDPIAPLAPAAADGEVAGISYHIEGSGPPLLLFPLKLAASQWQPLLPALTAHFTTILLGGAYLWPVAQLEQRARAGYLRVVRTLFEDIALRPGERVLEAGCGSGAVVRWLARRTAGANPIVGVDINRFLLGEAAGFARQEGVADAIHLQEGNAEALPFPPGSFDVAVSCTVMEEGDADRMLAELIRVTRPGGRVGVIVRATDMQGWNNLSLPPAVRANAGRGGGFGVAAAGCGDASLYRRFQASELTDVQMGPQFATTRADPSLHSVRAGFEGGEVASLSPGQAAVWRAVAARAEADNLLMWAGPLHCAVGTKP